MSGEIEPYSSGNWTESPSGASAACYKIGESDKGFHEKLTTVGVAQPMQYGTWSPPYQTQEQAETAGQQHLNAWLDEQREQTKSEREREANAKMANPPEDDRLQSAINGFRNSGMPETTPPMTPESSDVPVQPTPTVPGFSKKGVAQLPAQSYQEPAVNPTVQEARDRAAHTPSIAPEEPEKD